MRMVHPTARRSGGDVTALLLLDRDGVETRYLAIFRLFLAWSVRGDRLRVFGPFNLN